MCTKQKCLRVFLVCFVLSTLVPSQGHSIWRKPGCHKVGIQFVCFYLNFPTHNSVREVLNRRSGVLSDFPKGFSYLSKNQPADDSYALRFCNESFPLHLTFEFCKCHPGHTRKVSIPDCVEFHITTNACRGFCESWSIPSGMETLRVNPFQLITSVGQCCNIMETEDVDVKVMCLDGTRDLTFKSAKSCSCYHCKKD